MDSGYAPSHSEDTSPPLVPSGDRENVDYMRIPTAKEPPGPTTAKEGEDRRERERVSLFSSSIRYKVF